MANRVAGLKLNFMYPKHNTPVSKQHYSKNIATWSENINQAHWMSWMQKKKHAHSNHTFVYMRMRTQWVVALWESHSSQHKYKHIKLILIKESWPPYNQHTQKLTDVYTMRTEREKSEIVCLSWCWVCARSKIKEKKKESHSKRDRATAASPNTLKLVDLWRSSEKHKTFAWACALSFHSNK